MSAVRKRRLSFVTTSFLVVLLGGCSRQNQTGTDRDTHHTVGEVAGKLAYKASRQAERAAVVAGRELHTGAVEAHRGWKEAATEDRAKLARKKESGNK